MALQMVKNKTIIMIQEKEYYGIALQLSDDEESMCCVLQMGTGNTIETSNLVEKWFPYSAMKNIINNFDGEFFVRKDAFFKVKISLEPNKISYEFSKEEETAELISLLKKPDYFVGIDRDFWND